MSEYIGFIRNFIDYFRGRSLPPGDPELDRMAASGNPGAGSSNPVRCLVNKKRDTIWPCWNSEPVWLDCGPNPSPAPQMLRLRTAGSGGSYALVNGRRSAKVI